MKARTSHLVLLLAILALAAIFFLFDLDCYLILESLKAKQKSFADFYAADRLLTIGCYFIFYVIVTALLLQGATVMTLARGALLGLWTALVTVSFTSTIGATLAFLVSRFLLRNWVQARFGDKLKSVNAGF